MLYKINKDYYVKVGCYFKKVNLVYSSNDVTLEPTNEKIECNNSIVFEEINFLSIKDKLLEEHKKHDVKEYREQPKFNKKYSK